VELTRVAACRGQCSPTGSCLECCGVVHPEGNYVHYERACLCDPSRCATACKDYCSGAAATPSGACATCESGAGSTCADSSRTACNADPACKVVTSCEQACVSGGGI
jgi:hypothetical protein